MTPELIIDGSQGEGGGQIVRSSLALALVTGRPVAIENIRAGRDKPGLMRQHLTAVQAAAAVCGGTTNGAEIGSSALSFEPQPVRAGQHHFRVGTAGSATLVLQTILPALLIAEGRSTLVLEGGTHNPWAPPFDFLDKAFLPLVNRMGPRVVATLDRYGFYPAGGGRFTVTIEPCPRLTGFQLLERGPITSRRARAIVANLPAHIATREVRRILDKLTWDRSTCDVEQVASQGPGNIVCVEIGSEPVTEVFTSCGRAGTKAERVADEVVRQVRDYLSTEAPVGPFLADQLLLPLGISAWQARQDGRPGGGAFCTLPLTRHSTTHLDILRQFLDIEIEVVPSEDAKTCRVRVGACERSESSGDLAAN